MPLCILCCLYQRLETGRALGLVEGDAHVIRNAGGRVHDALRSLTISQQLLGTEEVLIIHHTVSHTPAPTRTHSTRTAHGTRSHLLLILCVM